VAAWLSKRVEVALAQVELTLPQYRVLGILAEGAAAASGLADRLAVRRPSITALIDGLVARGLVDTPPPGGHRPRRRPPAGRGGADGPALARVVGAGDGRVPPGAPPRDRGRGEGRGPMSKT